MSSREIGSPMAHMAFVESTKLSGLHGVVPENSKALLDDADEVAGTESDGGSSDGSEGELKKNPRDPEDVGGIPSKIPRHCTDVHWIFVYFLFSAIVVAIGVSVFPGQPETLLKLADWKGEKCGLYRNRGKPYLYFCPSEHSADRLQMWYPICVSSCPQAEMMTCPKNLNQERTTITTTLLYHSIMDSRNGGLPYPPYPVPDAYARYPPQNVFPKQPYLHPQVSYPPPMYPPPPPGGPWKTPWHPEGSTTAEASESSEPRRLDGQIVHSDWRGNFTFYEVKSYTSAPFVDLMCKPWVQDLERMVQRWIDETPLVNTWATLINSYWPLLVSAAMGVIMSYVFMTMLRFRAAILVKTGMVLLSLGPLVTGLYYIYAWRRGDGKIWGSTGEKWTDGVVGFLGLICGLTFATISFRLQEATDLAVECIEWSCKAVLETPSLKLEPILALASRGIVDLACVALISMILTSELEDDEVEENTDGQHRLLPRQSGLQLLMLATVSFWCLWTNMIITAISDFVIMYTAELWVFQGGLTRAGGHVPWCSLLRGYYTCLRYHFGSMVVGGLVVGCCQPFRLALAVVAFVITFEGNSLSILSRCCDCLVVLYLDFFEPWCRNAYMDLALNGHPFQQSALHASMVNSEFMMTVNILNGATWVFQLAGLGAISSLGYFQTCVIVRYYPGFTDPFSADYVQNPLLLSILGSVVAFVMAFPFMMIFDTVSDTILFAYIVQKIREEKDEEPTIFSRACGFVESLDDFIGLGCLDKRKKDYSMPKLFQQEPDADEEMSAGVPDLSPGDPLSMKFA